MSTTTTHSTGEQTHSDLVKTIADNLIANSVLSLPLRDRRREASTVVSKIVAGAIRLHELGKTPAGSALLTKLQAEIAPHLSLNTDSKRKEAAGKAIKTVVNLISGGSINLATGSYTPSQSIGL